MSNENEPLLGQPEVHQEPTFWSSFKVTVFSSYINYFLIFVPIAIVFSVLDASPTVVFTLNFIAIIPLAKLLGFATEEIALRSGSTIGALLNATFGNAVELILGVIALKEGLIPSVLGSILSNLLLVLGFCFFLGGINRTEQKFNVTAAQTSCSLLAVTTLSLLVPAAFSASTPEEDTVESILELSHGVSIVLLIVYILYLLFQLKTHTFLYEDEEDETEVPSTTLPFSVGTIEGVVEKWGINETFVGLILLPIVGNAAEHVSAVTFAMKDKMNLCIGIAISSSLQIGLLVTPVLVLAGWAINQPMTLFFEDFETVILFASVLIVNYLIQDGRSNCMTLESNTMTHHNSRKSHRVYRSPSSPNEPSPYAKSSKDTMMEIDAKDEEAGTILMALSQHATRIRSHSSATAAAAAAASAMAARSNSMGIRPYQSVSTGYKPHYETRRKGFQICLTQRSAVSTDEDMYHHRRKQRSFSRYPIHHTNHNNHSKYHPVLKIRGNTAHIHISYRIHAHQASLYKTNTPKPTKTIHSSYPRTSHSAPYMDHHHAHPYSYRQEVLPSRNNVSHLYTSKGGGCGEASLSCMAFGYKSSIPIRCGILKSAPLCERLDPVSKRMKCDVFCDTDG
ncbi:Sodium/calcium exchanger protein-domain-containing protein [Mucor lusitanicus]